MRKLAGLLALATLAFAPAAAAGGWATVGVSPLPPTDGSDWNVTLIIKQHGKTPLDNVTPTITISNDGGETRTFTASHAGKPGTYRATVDFPSDGTWSYVINDGFSRTHTFAPVTIGAAGTGDAFPTLTVTIAVALGLALAALLVFFARRRRPQPHLAPTP
jgi:YtkA-like protein